MAVLLSAHSLCKRFKLISMGGGIGQTHEYQACYRRSRISLENRYLKRCPWMFHKTITCLRGGFEVSRGCLLIFSYFYTWGELKEKQWCWANLVPNSLWSQDSITFLGKIFSNNLEKISLLCLKKAGVVLKEENNGTQFWNLFIKMAHIYVVQSLPGAVINFASFN